MKKFTYIAIDANKNSVKGSTEQNDRAAVIAALSKQGLRPISVKEYSAIKSSSFGNLDKYFHSNKVKSDQLVIMTRQLAAMVGAGVPLLRGINSLADHTESLALRNVLQAVSKDIEGGSAFGDALAKHPQAFNDVYVNMVRAGETAGILDEILNRLALQQEKSATIRKKIRGAMAYPTVLMCITILAFFGLMLFVIPQIAGILHSLGGPGAQLPAITLIMLAISGFITSFWWLILIIVVGAVLGISRYIKTPRGKWQFHSLILKLPGVSGVVRKVAISRFARTFSALMGAGVDVIECLNVTGRAVGNVVYEKALTDAGKEITNGKSLSLVIGDNPLFPPIVSQMLAVGEETGQTDRVLIKVADFYDEEVDVAINSVSAIIEPVMIVIMGGMVGLIAASVMVPIASLSTSIK